MSLNRNQLKYIAIACMLVDHIAWTFYPEGSIIGQWMHFFGRFTAPIMVFFVVEGYQHTRSIKKYALRMGLFALVSWIPFSLMEFQSITVISGIITNLFIGLLLIWMEDQWKGPRIAKYLIHVIALFCSLFADWPLFAVLWIVLLYRYRDSRKQQLIAYYAIAAFAFFVALAGNWPPGYRWYHAGMFLPPVLIFYLYNGESGSKHPFHKWFFYLFYPAHMLLLYFLKLNLG